MKKVVFLLVLLMIMSFTVACNDSDTNREKDSDNSNIVSTYNEIEGESIEIPSDEGLIPGVNTEISTDDSEILVEQLDLGDAIVGAWRITEESDNVNKENYPENDTIIFSKDGTWNYDEGNTYIISGDTIVMDSDDWVSQYTYVISIQNDVLMIRYPGDEALYFNRVG